MVMGAHNYQPPTTMLRIGHRGACGHAPENTIASMQKALSLGVWGFEFDIQLSKDGVPVVIHDATLERTTNGKGLVAAYTAAELKNFDAGGGEKSPRCKSCWYLSINVVPCW
jgi:glycerophosphoryl diester phosphodiesterase